MISEKWRADVTGRGGTEQTPLQQQLAAIANREREETRCAAWLNITPAELH
jgi:hypothetical protein